MQSHIERLAAACGLTHFAYRPWPAPELVLLRRDAPSAPAVEAALLDAAAEAASLDAAPVPGVSRLSSPKPGVAAEPDAPVRDRAPSMPPVTVLPLTLRNVAPEVPGLPQGRPPVVLPPPVTAPAAQAEPQRPRMAGRPPVVLPPPDEFDPIIAFRTTTDRAEASSRPAYSRAAPPRPASDRPASDRLATDRLATDRPAMPRPVAAPAAAGSRPATPARRFALLDEIMPPPARPPEGHDRRSPTPPGPRSPQP